MFFLGTLVVSVLYMEISIAENLYDKMFYTMEDNGLYFLSREAVNWTDAKANCKNADLELASVTSQEELLALISFITLNNLIPEDKWSGYWLSGVRHNDGKYYWDSTGTELDSSLRGWAWGEPSHAYGKEDCIELKWDQVNLGWNDYFCDETRKYICQFPRKLKTKNIKKKLEKSFVLKEWQTKKNHNYDLTNTFRKKEGDYYENTEDLEAPYDEHIYYDEIDNSTTTELMDMDIMDSTTVGEAAVSTA